MKIDADMHDAVTHAMRQSRTTEGKRASAPSTFPSAASSSHRWACWAAAHIPVEQDGQVHVAVEV